VLSRAVSLLVLLATSCTMLAISCASEDGKPLRIVLVTLDTLRSDTLFGSDTRPSAMPETHALTRRGLVFESFYAAMPTTLPSHASMLTGLQPWEHGLTRNGLVLSPMHETVAEILRQAGFRTAAVVASAPLHSRFGLSKGFETYVDDFDLNPEKKDSVGGADLPEEKFYSLADTVTRRARRVLSELEGECQLVWIHYFDPHDPYGDTRGSDLRTRGQILALGAVESNRTGHATATVRLVRDLYDADAAFLDARLAPLLRDILEDESFLTHVIIAADHGESLGEDGILGHGMHVRQEQLRVPLIVFSPRLGPGTRTDPVGSIDVAATLLDLAGVEARVAGRSLLQPSLPDHGVFGMRRTYDQPVEDVRIDGSHHSIPERVYFALHGGVLVTGNPDEVTSGSDNPALGIKLRGLFAAFQERLSRTGAGELVDENMQKALEALGYVK